MEKEMAITASLQLGDNSIKMYSRLFRVVDWHGHFFSPHNNIRPNGAPQCESLDITLVAPSKEDLSLYEWFIENSVQSGRLLLDYSGTLHSDDTAPQEVVFENAYCYGITEQYDIDDKARRTLTLKIVPEQVIVSEVEFKNI